MTTTIIGFPRIGKKRELKFATEKYFRKEITAVELQQVAQAIRLENWQLQKKVGMMPISNDFSFYDQLLDLTVTLNAVATKYTELKLNTLDTYFAQARGFQDDTRDVKARPMKKWFNTNYHYLVPEISKEIEIKGNFSKLTAEYLEAKKQGIETKPTIIGPYTFLRLAEYTDDLKASDVKKSVATAYKVLFSELNQLGVQWVQIEEPALVLDQTDEDLALFDSIYQDVLTVKGTVKVQLQTYFGDIRDSYQTVLNLPFDGVGLDFVEGKETLNLIKKHGFPKDKVLFAGVINGKNIWRNDYQKTIALFQQLPQDIQLVINTSCSLQHVPVTTASEEKLDQGILQHFAFAIEKLHEIQELSQAYFEKNSAILTTNKELFAQVRIQENKALKQKIHSLLLKDYTRQPALIERRAVQKKQLQLPVLPTTTIGSFPQTSEIRRTRLAYRNGELDTPTYETFLEEQTRAVIKLQEKIGLDVLVHGEFERNDMVEYFGEQLDGYVFTEFAWVQSYGTRCVKPPIIWGDVTRPRAMTVRWSSFAQGLTNKYMKGMLTGPVTILNWSFPREDISVKESALQLALAIQQEVLDLEAAGIKIIQIDEAALREKLPLRKSDWYSEYLDWAIPAFRLVHSKVKPRTQIHTHMCYSEFEDIISAIDEMDADVISFEASRCDLSIIDALKTNNFQTLVGPGVYDIHSPRIPSTEEIKTQISRILKKLPLEQVWINPDCGLKTRGNEETKPSLEHLVQATLDVRKEVEKNGQLQEDIFI